MSKFGAHVRTEYIVEHLIGCTMSLRAKAQHCSEEPFHWLTVPPQLSVDPSGSWGGVREERVLSCHSSLPYPTSIPTLHPIPTSVPSAAPSHQAWSDKPVLCRPEFPADLSDKQRREEDRDEGRKLEKTIKIREKGKRGERGNKKERRRSKTQQVQ